MQAKTDFYKLFALTLSLSVIAFYPWQWLGFSLPKQFLLSLGLSLCFFMAALKSEKLQIHWRETWPTLSYFALLLFYTFFSVAPFSSLLGLSNGQWGLVVQFLYFGVFLWAINMPFQHWVKMLLWLNGLVAAYALIQLLELDPLTFFWKEEAFLNRSFSVLGNPNWLASFLVLTFPVGFYALKKSNPWWIGFVTINVLALFSTGSKAGFLAALFLGIVILKKNKHWKKAMLALALMMLAALIYFYADPWVLTRSLGSRMHLWQGAWQAFLAQPWGYGLDTFWAIFPAFSNPDLWQTEGLNTMITHPHNLFLEKLLEIGPWGLLLFMGMMVIPLKKNWNQPNEKAWITYGLLAYLITLLFGFETLGTGIVFWLLFGSLFYKSTSSPQKSTPWQKIGLLGMGFLFLILTFLNVEHLRANLFYEQGRKAQQQGSLATALAQFESAIQIYPYDRVYLLQSTELLLALKGEETAPLNQAEKHLKQLDRLSLGQDPELSIFKAWLAGERGDLKSFQAQLQKAFLVHPASGNNYKIALHLYKKWGWKKEYEALKTQLYNNLPDYWKSPETTAGRIFQKNHPWILSL